MKLAFAFLLFFSVHSLAQFDSDEEHWQSNGMLLVDGYRLDSIVDYRRTIEITYDDNCVLSEYCDSDRWIIDLDTCIKYTFEDGRLAYANMGTSGYRDYTYDVQGRLVEYKELYDRIGSATITNRTYSYDNNDKLVESYEYSEYHGGFYLEKTIEDYFEYDSLCRLISHKYFNSEYSPSSGTQTKTKEWLYSYEKEKLIEIIFIENNNPEDKTSYVYTQDYTSTIEYNYSNNLWIPYRKIDAQINEDGDSIFVYSLYQDSIWDESSTRIKKYNDAGQLLSNSSKTKTNEYLTEYEYDHKGQLLQVLNITNMEFDDATNFKYDSDCNLIEKTESRFINGQWEVRSTESWAYNSIGAVSTFDDDGNIKKYYYSTCEGISQNSNAPIDLVDNYVFPNPTFDVFYPNLKLLNQMEITKLEVYNQYGNLVKSTNLEVFESNQTLGQNLIPGNYTLIGRNKNGNIAVQKLIKL